MRCFMVSGGRHIATSPAGTCSSSSSSSSSSTRHFGVRPVTHHNPTAIASRHRHSAGPLALQTLHVSAALAAPAQQPATRRYRCSSTAPQAEPVPPLVVVEGDVVTFHMTCREGEDGQVLESSREAGEPLSFEIGAGEIAGNPLYQAFDGALRGLGINDVIELEISGGDWKQELLFTVPRDHPEVERLEGRYKNLGGLHKDLAVELANGSMAVVVEATPEYVKLDANNLMSGKKLLFELEVLGIERPEA